MLYTPRMDTAYTPHTARHTAYSNANGFSNPAMYSHARRSNVSLLLGRRRLFATVDGRGSSHGGYGNTARN